MRGKVLTLMAPIAAIAALAVGGVAYAANGNTQAAKPKATVTAPENNSGPDTDTIQSGDQTTPDTNGNAEPASSENGNGSEVPGNDGPGGHADEPGNPNADHQFSGK
jgi:hypothetical protein